MFVLFFPFFSHLYSSRKSISSNKSTSLNILSISVLSPSLLTTIKSYSLHTHSLSLSFALSLSLSLNNLKLRSSLHSSTRPEQKRTPHSFLSRRRSSFYPAPFLFCIITFGVERNFES